MRDADCAVDEIISDAAAAGIRNVFAGMGHRGRLNVMSHVIHTSFEEILAELGFHSTKE